MNTTPLQAPANSARTAMPTHSADIHSLFGEYAALAQHPGEEDDRLALAIRVFEALRLSPARPS